VPLVEKELLTLSEHLSSSPVFSEVRVPRSLVSIAYTFTIFIIQFLKLFISKKLNQLRHEMVMAVHQNN
jgi:hypothetical protein